MALVTVEVEGIELGSSESDMGIASLLVRCTKCGNEVEVYGRSERSFRRGCMMLKEECTENNFYKEDPFDTEYDHLVVTG
jgi:hypothetical protein